MGGRDQGAVMTGRPSVAAAAAVVGAAASPGRRAGRWTPGAVAACAAGRAARGAALAAPAATSSRSP